MCNEIVSYITLLYLKYLKIFFLVLLFTDLPRINELSLVVILEF